MNNSLTKRSLKLTYWQVEVFEIENAQMACRQLNLGMGKHLENLVGQWHGIDN